VRNWVEAQVLGTTENGDVNFETCFFNMWSKVIEIYTYYFNQFFSDIFQLKYMYVGKGGHTVL